MLLAILAMEGVSAEAPIAARAAPLYRQSRWDTHSLSAGRCAPALAAEASRLERYINVVSFCQSGSQAEVAESSTVPIACAVAILTFASESRVAPTSALRALTPYVASERTALIRTCGCASPTRPSRTLSDIVP